MSKEENLKFVSDAVLREILRKKQILEKDPQYSFYFSNGKKKSLRDEANKHSVSLEMVGYNTRTSEGRREKSREEKRSMRNLNKAMEWGLSNYEGRLDEDFIEQTGYKVDPKTNEKGYRTNRVRITGSTWSPPSPEKLKREMLYFLYENGLLDNVIDKAVHAHFHIARIHPFLDGNGRTARAVQNIILEDSGYFPAIVRLDERVEYVHLIDQAVDSYRKKEGDLTSLQEERAEEINNFLMSGINVSEKHKGYFDSIALELGKARMAPEQNDFYNFMALKVRDSLREVSEKIYKDRYGKRSHSLKKK